MNYSNQKIVIDTNIFLSALMSKDGASSFIVKSLFENPQKINCISTPILFEIQDVIFRPENLCKYSQFSKNDLESFIDDICSISNETRLHFLWRPFLKDYKDDKILETALNSQSSCIITFNLKDFENVESNFEIKVITPSQYLKMLRG